MSDSTNKPDIFKKFQIVGRLAHGKYLEKERKNAIGKPNKRKYLNYIENQIIYNDRRLAELNGK